MNPAIVECLDRALSSQRRHARVETPAMTIGLGPLAHQFERATETDIRRIAEGLPLAKRRPTYIFTCEDERYGAFAMRDQFDYIVLNIGLLPTLTHFFPRMMANAENFPGVGNPLSPESQTSVAESASAPAHSAWRHLPRRDSTDPTRQELAVQFIAVCLSLIALHEFAHLVLGHLDPAIQATINADPLAAQALELAADAHAAIWGRILNQAKRAALNQKLPKPIPEGMRAFHRTPEQSIENYLLAVFLVFRIMDETKWSDETLASRPHPPAPFRFQVVCLHLANRLNEAGDSDGANRLRSVATETWERGKAIFARALGRNPDRKVMTDTMSDECERHYERVSERARTLPEHLFNSTR